MHSLLLCFFASLAFAPLSSAHAIPAKRAGSSAPATSVTTEDPLKLVAQGNARFIHEIETQSPNLLVDLTKNGQKPPFALISCSDSRLSEGTIFDALPGTFFTHRNIANRYAHLDSSANSFLAYGVMSLGAQHVVVMGHYGCGGVQAAMMPKSNATVDASSALVQNWIDPIRDLYQYSQNPAIVASRAAPLTTPPGYEDAAFRALIEENIKRSAKTLSTDPTIINSWNQLAAQGGSNSTDTAHRKRASADVVPVFIHSWVYDIQTGHVKDLEYSFGPSGYPIPMLASQQKVKRCARRV